MILISVTLSLPLCGCTAAENTLEVGKLVVSYPSELAPKGASSEGTTLTRTSGDNKQLIYLQEAYLYNDDRTIRIEIKMYSGVSFDEALNYAEEKAYPATPSRVSEEAVNTWHLDASDCGESECEAPELTEMNGRRSFIQRWWGIGDNDMMAKSITECVEVDENTIGVLYCLAAEDALQANRSLLDEVFANVQVR